MADDGQKSPFVIEFNLATGHDLSMDACRDVGCLEIQRNLRDAVHSDPGGRSVMKAIDLEKLEHEIVPDHMPSFLRKEMHPAGVGASDDINRYAPPLRPLPEYVEHKAGVPRVGALSAQAV